VLTGPQWRELGKGSGDDIPKKLHMAIFGMLLADGTRTRWR
jgi:hypothetical protein